MKGEYIEIAEKLVQEYDIVKWVKVKKGYKKQVARVRCIYKLQKVEQIG